MLRKSQIEIDTLIKIALYGALTLAVLAILLLIAQYLGNVKVFS